MTGSIKFFQTVKKSYKILGIHPPQENGKFPFNPKSLFFLFCYAQFCTGMAAFFVIEAKSIYEYGNSFYMFFTQFFVMLDFFVLMWRIPTISELIAELEEFIEKSKKRFCRPSLF